MERSVIVASGDSTIVSQIGELLKQYRYKVVFENLANKALLYVLENNVDIFIYDLTMNDESMISMINVVHRTKPKLPIIVLCEDTSLETMRKLNELGVFYCAMHPVQTEEMEKVMEAIERLHKKEKASISEIEEKELSEENI